MSVEIVNLTSDDEEEDNNIGAKHIHVKQELSSLTKESKPCDNPSSSRTETNGMIQENGHKNGERENIPSTSYASESTNALKRMLDECLSIENSPKMEAIVSKMWKAYNRLNSTYRVSQDFILLLNENHSSVVDDPKNKCKFIKIVKEEMDYHRNLKRSHSSDKIFSPPKKRFDSSPQASTSNHYSDTSDNAPDNDSDDEVKKKKKAFHLKELWKGYYKCKKRIKKLESLEVDWDDEDDSAYLKEDAYKRRLIKIYNKIQALTDNSLGKPLRKKIFVAESEYPELNSKVEKFINKKREFPDFQDVEEVISAGNREYELKLSDADIHNYAVKAFECIGKQMKKHRCHELSENLGLLLPETVIDPAEKDFELEKKLKENQEQYKNREAELMSKFTQKSEEMVKEREMKIKEGVPVEEEKSDNESEEEEEGEEEKQPEVDISDHSSDSEAEENEEHKDHDHYSEEEEEVAQVVPAATTKDADCTGYVSTPGNTPEEIFVSSQDESTTQPFSLNSRDSNRNSPGIKLLEVFSLAETPEKLPVECSLLTEHDKSSAMKVLGLQLPRIDDNKNLKPTTSFADVFKKHLETCNEDITHEIIPTVKVPNVNNNVITEEVECNNDTKITVSKIYPLKHDSSRPLLVVSPKLTVDIPSSVNAKPQYRAQKARKSFPRFQPPVSPKIEPIKEEKNLQTPEITSSSQDNKFDSDDDCIVLSD